MQARHVPSVFAFSFYCKRGAFFREEAGGGGVPRAADDNRYDLAWSPETCVRIPGPLSNHINVSL